MPECVCLSVPLYQLSQLSHCPAACMSVSVCLPSLSQHIQSVKWGTNRGSEGERRSVRYNTGLWNLVVVLLYLVCRYGGTKLHIAAALCRRLCGHSLPPSSLFSLLHLQLLLLVCVFCLFLFVFFFFDLIENLENQVNSLGDSRQCICGWIV